MKDNFEQVGKNLADMLFSKVMQVNGHIIKTWDFNKKFIKE